MSNDDKGRSELELIQPCLARVRFYGKLEGSDIAELMDRLDHFAEGLDCILIEANMTGVVSASAEARRVAAERLSQLPKNAIAIVGGGFSQRVLGKLVLTAVQMLTRGHTKSDFFRDSDAAVEWLWKVAKDHFGVVQGDP